MIVGGESTGELKANVSLLALPVRVPPLRVRHEHFIGGRCGGALRGTKTDRSVVVEVLLEAGLE